MFWEWLQLCDPYEARAEFFLSRTLALSSSRRWHLRNGAWTGKSSNKSCSQSSGLVRAKTVCSQHCFVSFENTKSTLSTSCWLPVKKCWAESSWNLPAARRRQQWKRAKSLTCLFQNSTTKIPEAGRNHLFWLQGFNIPCPLSCCWTSVVSFSHRVENADGAVRSTPNWMSIARRHLGIQVCPARKIISIDSFSHTCSAKTFGTAWFFVVFLLVLSLNQQKAQQTCFDRLQRHIGRPTVQNQREYLSTCILQHDGCCSLDRTRLIGSIVAGSLHPRNSNI